MVWYSLLFKNFPQFVLVHRVKGFIIVSEAELDVFLEFSCFFYDPVDVDNLISGSSVFSKCSLDIWKFLFCIILKPSVQDFKHDLTSLGDECDCAVVSAFFGIAFLWDEKKGMKTDLFQSCGHC